MKKVISIILLGILMQGCISAQEHRVAVQDNSTDNITVGKVQREIKKGMSSAGVIQALGSPNIVSTDKDGNEVWIYDKVSSNSVSSSSSGGVGVVGDVNILILSGSSNSAASLSSQKTLTIIIKFDESNKVRDFSYRTSSF